MEGRETRLEELLASSLPRDHSFKYHHVSTPPTSCAALYSPPPGHKPEKTSCESHMLNVSISPSNDFDKDSVAVFAVEVYIYRTRHLTTLFVSKADTTGWISLLKLPKGHASIIKTLSSTFVSYLIRKCHKPDRRLVLSLFARAQSQYLYPGSDENKTKHILDDRQLVKWWCRTLDPVLREYEGEEQIDVDQEQLATTEDDGSHIRSKAYLIVPGHDRYETTAFFPQSARSDPADNKRWHAGHPLHELATFPNAPPRCLVPHFPDDPKSRFLLDLDIELKDAPPPHSSQSQSQSSNSSSQHALLNPQESPSKRGKGQWKSVKTLEQFWEMMAFRQECSSGRLVGFLWMVFTPDSLDDSLEKLDIDPLKDKPTLAPTQTTARTHATTPRIPYPSIVTSSTPITSANHDAARSTPALAKKRRKRLATSKKPAARIARRKGRRTGIIVARAPRIKTALSLTDASAGPGTLRLTPRAYARAHEVLVRLDFAGPAVARQSTAKWAREAGIAGGLAGGGKDWGVVVTGRAEPAVTAAVGVTTTAPVTMLGVKRKATDDGTAAASGSAGAGTTATAATGDGASVNVLGVGTLRKKQKPAPGPTISGDAAGANGSSGNDEQHDGAGGQAVRELAAGLVRKKPK